LGPNLAYGHVNKRIRSGKKKKKTGNWSDL
jgi:hypothetical protein